MVTQMRAWRDGQMAGENGDGMDVEAQKKLMAFFKTETERFYKVCSFPLPYYKLTKLGLPKASSSVLHECLQKYPQYRYQESP